MCVCIYINMTEVDPEENPIIQMIMTTTTMTRFSLERR